MASRGGQSRFTDTKSLSYENTRLKYILRKMQKENASTKRQLELAQSECKKQKEIIKDLEKKVKEAYCPMENGEKTESQPQRETSESCAHAVTQSGQRGRWKQTPFVIVNNSQHPDMKCDSDRPKQLHEIQAEVRESEVEIIMDPDNTVSIETKMIQEQNNRLISELDSSINESNQLFAKYDVMRIQCLTLFSERNQIQEQNNRLTSVLGAYIKNYNQVYEEYDAMKNENNKLSSELNQITEENNSRIAEQEAYINDLYQLYAEDDDMRTQCLTPSSELNQITE